MIFFHTPSFLGKRRESSEERSKSLLDLYFCLIEKTYTDDYFSYKLDNPVAVTCPKLLNK
jgi:hypothetical protein